MKKKRKPRDRGQEAINRAIRVIDEAGWKSSFLKHPTTGRFVAVKYVHEREDDSTTSLFESDYTVEGLAALVTRREREEGRKA